MGAIVKFALPYLLSCFLQIFYGLADLFFVGRYCGVSAITAVSIGSQVMHMVTVMICSLAMGTTVLVATATGAGDRNRMLNTIGNSITLFGGLSVLLAAVLILCINPINNMLSTPTEAIGETSQYLLVCFAGIPVIVAYNILASIYRGLGDSRSPMYFIAVACLVNVLLDYIFIGLMGAGALGAAFATITAQLVSVVSALIAMRRRKERLTVSRDNLRLSRHTTFQLLKVGLPLSLQDGFIQIGFLVITMIANMRGITDAAAVGIVEKVIGIFFLIPSSMLSTVSALAAQNIGAGKPQRAHRTMWYAVMICAGFGIIASIITQFMTEDIVAMFTDDADVIVHGGDYLSAYVWDCLIAGIHFCFSGFFCACGRSMLSFIHNVISMSCFRVPLAFAASEMYPDTLMPMGVATLIGSFTSLLMCIGFYIWIVRKSKESIRI